MHPPHIPHRPHFLLSLLLLLVTSACSNDEPVPTLGGVLPREDSPYYLNLMLLDKKGNNLVEGIKTEYVKTSLIQDKFLARLLTNKGIDSIRCISSDEILITVDVNDKKSIGYTTLFVSSDSLQRDRLSVYHTMLFYDFENLDFYAPLPYWPTYKITLKSQKLFGDNKNHSISSHWNYFRNYDSNICDKVTFDGKKTFFELYQTIYRTSDVYPSNIYDVTILIDH